MSDILDTNVKVLKKFLAEFGTPAWKMLIES